MNAAAQQFEEGLASWHVYQVGGLPGDNRTADWP